MCSSSKAQDLSGDLRSENSPLVKMLYLLRTMVPEAQPEASLGLHSASKMLIYAYHEHSYTRGAWQGVLLLRFIHTEDFSPTSLYPIPSCFTLQF